MDSPLRVLMSTLLDLGRAVDVAAGRERVPSMVGGAANG